MSDSVDMRDTIIPKSDQLNADDLIGGPITVTITKVLRANTAEQPIAVRFDGDNGKPFFPCKSMRRVMVQVWGPYAEEYEGRAMTLFRDPKVLWGGMAVGGIRISHMSHMEDAVSMALTLNDKKKQIYKVLPLAVAQNAPQAPAEPDKATTAARALTDRFNAVVTAQDYYTILDDEKTAPQMQWLKEKRPALFADVDAARAAASERMTDAPAPDATAQDGEMPE